jgi:hypothetical protein
MAYLVCDRPLYFEEKRHRIAMVDAISGSVFQLLEHRFADVKFKKTKEEKEERRRLYRQKYMKRPHVLEKLKKRLADPAVVKARKEYAEKPEVKERKKNNAKRNREIPSKLKKLAPAIYHEIVKQVTHGEEGPLSTTLGCLGTGIDITRTILGNGESDPLL